MKGLEFPQQSKDSKSCTAMAVPRSSTSLICISHVPGLRIQDWDVRSLDRVALFEPHTDSPFHLSHLLSSTFLLCATPNMYGLLSHWSVLHFCALGSLNSSLRPTVYPLVCLFGSSAMLAHIAPISVPRTTFLPFPFFYSTDRQHTNLSSADHNASSRAPKHADTWISRDASDSSTSR